MTAPARTPQDRKPAKKATTTKAAARKSAAAPETSAVLAVEAVPVPVDRPEGMPSLTPLVGAPRRQRAAFLRAFREMQARFPDGAEFTEAAAAFAAESESPQQRQKLMDVAVDTLELAADVEDCLTAMAADSSAFAAWVAAASDETLFQAFSWYVQENPVGEALASLS